MYLSSPILLEVASRQSPKKAKTAAVVYTTDLQARPPIAQKFAGGRVVETALLRQCQETGFVVADFLDGHKQTFELVNLVLETINKPGTHGKASAKAKAAAAKKAVKKKEKAKKKATKKNRPNSGAEDLPPSGLEPAVASLPANEYKSYGFGVMYYKNTTTIGIRKKTGECNQVFSFGGKDCRQKSKADMWQVGLKIIKMFENGSSYDSAKAAGQMQAKELVDQ